MGVEAWWNTAWASVAMDALIDLKIIRDNV